MARMLRVILFFLVVVFFPGMAVWAEETHAPRTLIFTSDEDEKIIYQNSPAARAASGTAAPSPTTDQESAGEEGAPENGLKRLVITPDAGKTNTKKDDEETSSSKESPAPPKQDDKKEPTPPVALTPRGKLKPWPELQGLYAVAGTPEQIKRGLAPFEGHEGRIPPQGLVYMAGLYESMGDMKQAALYYYGAQLRARFDAKRFGPKGENARRQVARLAEMLNPRIGPWVAASSSRLLDTLASVRAWDRETPYDYHPGFGVAAADLAPRPDDLTRNDRAEPEDVGPEIPGESEWPDLLDAVRADFFRETGKLATALQKMGK